MTLYTCHCSARIRYTVSVEAESADEAATLAAEYDFDDFDVVDAECEEVSEDE